MKKQLCAAFSVLALTLMSKGSFAQDHSLLSHISPDAQAVYQVNFGSIFAKISWADMMARIPAHPGNNADMEGMDMLKDPAMAGIDIGKDVLVTTSGKDPKDSSSYITVVLHLADSSKFRVFLLKQSPKARIMTYSDKSYSAYKHKAAVSWNNEFAVVAILQSPVAQSPVAADHKQAAVRRSVTTLKGFTSSGYTGDPAFMAAFSDDADIHMCTYKGNSFTSLRNKLTKKGLGGLQLDSMIPFKRTLTGIRFEKGRITISTSTSLTPQAAEDLKKFNPPPFDPDLLARLPKGSLLGLLGFRMDLSFLGYMFGKSGIRAKVDSGLSADGLTLDGIGHAFKGDFLLAAIDPPHVDSLPKPKPAIYFVTTINDPSVLLKLVGMFGKKKDSAAAADSDADGGAMKKANMLGKMKDHFAIKDNILVISGSKEMAQAYLANTERRSTDFLTDRMKEDPFYMWIDLKTVVNLMLGPVSDTEPTDKKMKMMNGMHALDKVILTGGALHNGEVDGYLELRMIDQQQNALKTLLDIVPVK